MDVAEEEHAEAGPTVTAVSLSSCGALAYTAPVTIGSQTFQLVLDTASPTLGVASSACKSCGVSPEYTPGSTATDVHMTSKIQYSDGSGWSGEIYEDTVSAGAGPSAPVKLVAIDTQSQFFGRFGCTPPTAPQGILGLSPGGALPGTNEFFDQLAANAGVPNVFALELCDTAGTLWLGGYDPTFTTAPPQYTPSAGSFSDTNYVVNLVTIRVAGTSVPIATSQYANSIVDTGASAFVLSTQAFTAVTDAVGADAQFQQIFGFGSGVDGGGSAAASFWNGTNCASLAQTKEELDAKLPPMTLVFGYNPAISVQAVATESYLTPHQGTWCAGLSALNFGPSFPVASILGVPVLRSNVVIFDRANQRVGFAPHAACH